MSSKDSDNEVTNSQEYKTLNTHLSDDSDSLATTLDSFCKPTEETFMKSQSASEVENQLWRVWKAITTIATQTAHDSPGRQKLADFVLEVQKRPQLECKGEVCKIWDEAVVWKDLPILGPQMREAWNDAATDSSPSSARDAWVNLNAFTATLVATQQASSNQISDSPSDFSLYAIWTIRMALEDIESSQKADEADKTSLEAAAAWFAYAAPTLWALSEQGKEFQGKIAKQGQAVKGKEWRGFGKERWEFWEEKLEACGDGVELVAKAKEAAKSVRDGGKK